jgi:hypothetical protein
MEPEGSLLCSQEPATGFCYDPAHTLTVHYFKSFPIFLNNVCQTKLLIIPLSFSSTLVNI